LRPPVFFLYSFKGVKRIKSPIFTQLNPIQDKIKAKQGMDSKRRAQFLRISQTTSLPELQIVHCNAIPEAKTNLHFPVVRIYAVRSFRNYNHGKLMFTFVIGDATGLADVTCFVPFHFSQILAAKGLFIELKHASAKPTKLKYQRFYASASPLVIEIGNETTISILDMEQVNLKYTADQLAPKDGSIPSNWFRPMLNLVDERFHAKADRERKNIGFEDTQFAGYLAMDNHYVLPQNSEEPSLPIHGPIPPEVAAIDMFDAGDNDSSLEQIDEHEALCGDSGFIANTFPVDGTCWTELDISKLKHGMSFEIQSEGKSFGRGVVSLRDDSLNFVVLKRKQTIDVDSRDVQRSPVGHIHDIKTRAAATLHRIPKDEFKQWRKGLHLSMYTILGLQRPQQGSTLQGRLPSGRRASISEGIRCAGCNEPFANKWTLTRHYKRSSLCRAKTNMDDLPVYKCKLCDQLPYINERHFRNHVTKKHSDANFESALMSKDDLQGLNREEAASNKQLAMLPHKDEPYTSSEVLQVVSQWPTRTLYNVYYVEPSHKEILVSTGLFLGTDKNGDLIARFNPDLSPIIEKVDCTEKFEVRAVVPIGVKTKADKRVREDVETSLLIERRDVILDRLQLIRHAFESDAISAGVDLFMEAFDDLQDLIKK